ncbi:TPA: Transcription factor [Trebouxia sp. C0006]
MSVNGWLYQACKFYDCHAASLTLCWRTCTKQNHRHSMLPRLSPAQLLGSCRWAPSSISNPFQMALEQGPSQPVGNPTLGPLAEGSLAGPHRIMLPMAQTPTEPTARRVLHAFERWHAQHTVSVRALLEVRNQGNLAGLLAQRLANVVNHLLDFFRLKAAVLQGGEAHLVLSLQHLPHCQRRFAPLGVLSCSDICAGLLYKLGPSLEPHQRNFLQQYKTVVTSQEAALHVVLSGAIADMTQVVACVRVPLGLPPPQPFPLTTPDTQAKLQLMCDVFMAADRIWAEFLQHAEQYLSVPQFVSVVSAMAETGAGLEEICHSQAPS